ncbi:MAG TPA: hypothetical protein DIC56_13085 [Rhizobium sp.]|nr:hypothetical protein [Rhizobium sp.]
MQTALIMMTILGCDDSVSQCHYIATVERKWVSIELCHASSEQVLEGYSGVNYPMVIAVCQPPESNSAELQAPPENAQLPAVPTTPLPEAMQQSLAARAISKIRGVLPGTADIRMVFEKPLHVVADSYSWVAKKLTD